MAYRGFILLSALALLSTLWALLNKPRWGEGKGYRTLEGTVVNRSYGRFYLLTEEGELYRFYHRGEIFPYDWLRLEGKVRGSYVKPLKVEVKRNLLQRLRVKIHRTLKERFLKSAKTKFEKKLGSALLFGENWFSRKEKRKLSLIGIYHLVVISGMHYALLFSFFLVFPVRFKLRYWLALGFLSFFTFLVLFPKAPAYRAFTSFALFLAAKIGERLYSPLKALLWGYSLSLLFFPHWFYSLGFWLSYLASLGLILYYRSNRTPEENFLRNFFGNLLGLEATLVVTAVISPLLAYYFHFFSFGSFLYAWIFTLLTEFFLLVGILNTVTLWSFPPLVEAQHIISNAFGVLFEKVPERVYINLEPFPFWVAVVSVITALGILILIKRKRWLYLILLLLLEVFLFHHRDHL